MNCLHNPFTYRFVATALIGLILTCNAFGQVQATIAKQVIADGVQCSSTGIGVGRDNKAADDHAELNRARAERKAKRKGRHSFTNKTGGGAAVCEKIVIGKVNEVSILVPKYESLFTPFK